MIRPTGLLDPVIEIRPVLNQVDDLMSEIKILKTKNQRVLVTTLTKRMAEDLTKYLQEYGILVQYLHSDIDTVERVEIIRDLRLGKYDVLVGINLLREGLDMPEVALVAILDADKEGFLRSERSLIQTIGRAARNLEGRAILYADNMTQSIQKAVFETQRRREKQAAYNEAHGITPRGIIKRVHDMIEREENVSHEIISIQERRVVDPLVALKQITSLEKEMKRLADQMAFEQAAIIRDQILELKQHLGD